jgi:hypothetical protein
VNKAFNAIVQELKANTMPAEDFLVLLGILYSLHVEGGGGTYDNKRNKAEVERAKGRKVIVDELRASEVVLRAPRPQAKRLKQGTKVLKGNEKIENYYGLLEVTKECLEEELGI